MKCASSLGGEMDALGNHSLHTQLLASATLQTLMTGVFLIGLIFVVFGQAYSYLLLDIYGGELRDECYPLATTVFIVPSSSVNLFVHQILVVFQGLF
jgi:hypothetical protein